MKKVYDFSTLILFLLLLSQIGISQTINYPNSWGKHGITLLNENEGEVRINYSMHQFSFSDMEIDDEIMKSIHVPGIFLPNDEGFPDLPGTGKYIAVPQGSDVVVKIISSNTETFSNYDIAPAPRIPLDTDKDPLVYEKNMEVYSKNEFYPKEPVIISGKTKLRGVDIVMLGITPFQYNPVSKELIVYKDLQIEITFSGGNGIFGDQRLRSRWWDPVLGDAILNYQSLPEIDYNTTKNNNSRSPDYEYLIITLDDADFLSWADSIKLFRNLQGIKTGVVTTTDVGGNTVADIENYVDDAYNTWDVPPSAVLLLGDYGTGTSGITSQWYTHPAGYPDFVSDNKFADVNEDNLPDIAFARITANNASQLEVMITKFLDYERNPPSDANFYDHPITALGWQTTRWFQICSEVVGGYFTNVLGKNPVRINAVYSGNPSSDPWSTATNTSTVVNYFGPSGLSYIPATPQELGGFTGGTGSDVINAINSGSFLLQHRDHGSYTGWGEPAFNSTSINSLTNINNKLPYIFSINCQTGAFHRSTETFAEKFHRHTYSGQNSGALGVIAATEVSYSFVNDTYLWGVMDNLFPDFMPAEATTFPVNYVMPAFGNAAGKHFLYQSNWPYNTSSKLITYRLFHHHGGAFLTLYTEVPQNLSVVHDQEMVAGATVFTVTADAGSLIALTVSGEIIGTADGTGTLVDINIPPQNSGDVMVVTITKQNYYRYSENVDIVATGLYSEFTADNTSLCAGDAVTFTDQSIGSPVSWNWTFSGGTPGTYNGQNPPVIAYNTPGTYDVSLTISDGTTNDTETKTGYIIVTGITADFTGTPTTIIAGNSVSFTDHSTCNPTSWSWSFPGGTPDSYDGQNPPVITYNTNGTFDVILMVSNTSGDDTKTSIDYITVTDIQYCASNGNATDEWVASVDIDGQSNTSGSSGATGYEDFTGFTFNLNSGNSYTLTMNPGFSSKSKFEYWRVWIDFNQDGDFTDANEEVFAANKKKSIVNGTITIPSGLEVTTMMRISMKRGSAATSCELFAQGEVEDYTVNITEPVPQPPVADFSADKTIVGLGETVQFTDLSTNNPTSWSWTFTGGTPASSTAKNQAVTYNAVGTYNVSLTATNGVGSDTETKTGYIVVTDDPPPLYCEPTAINNALYSITSVSLGTTTSNTGQGSSGYVYYSNPVFDFNPGQSYPVNLAPNNSKRKFYWRIWMDLNNDGDFVDADETIFQIDNKKGTVNSTMTIPSSASGSTRMRVSMKVGSAPSSCEDGFGGEVEDYNATFGSEDFVATVDENFGVILYPNPVNGDKLNINISGSGISVTVVVYDKSGRVIENFRTDSRHLIINASTYKAGIYFIKISNGKETLIEKFIKM